MPACEMCGNQGEIKVKVEGVDLNVCQNCSKHGEIREYSKESSKQQKRVYFRTEEAPLRLVDSFPEILLKARQKKGWTQEEFAKNLNERESVIAKWEQGSMMPRIDVARRLEKVLGIKLVEEESFEQEVKIEKKGNEEFTLGDFIKVRKRAS